MLFGTWVFSALYAAMPGSWNDAPPLLHVLVHFNLGAENVIAAWFSSMLLLLVAGASMTAFAVDATSRHSRTLLHAGWVVLAVLFLGLSLDELGSLHERASTITRGPDEVVVGWYALMALLWSVLLFMAAFGLLHVRRVRAAPILMVAGVLCFASIPFQEKIEIFAYRAVGAGWQRPHGWLLLEEGTELAGSLFFLASALTYATAMLAKRSEAGGVLVLRLPLVRSLLAACILLALGGAGMIASRQLFGSTPVANGHGMPVNWFPAALAFAAAAFALCAERARGLPAARSVVVMQLVASAFAGANLYGWQFIAAPSLFLRVVLTAALTVGVGMAGMQLFRRVQGVPNRLGIVAWAVLLLWGMVSLKSSLVAPLLYASSSALLLVLLSDAAATPAEPTASGRDNSRGTEASPQAVEPAAHS
ncbi:MAG TPA: hypothetical protein VKZ41_03965 [Gemmatimonadales bacterium]|nr:hypothetical protein [Gemmatimonadales bacterium]